MKKNIAIIILSVCLVVTLLVSVALCLYLPYKQTRWRELLWEDYLIWCELVGCEIDFGKEPEGVPNAYATIRCLYSESFDLSIPRDPLPEKESYGPSGTYVYDIFIHADGTGSLLYQQWGTINTEIEEGHWTSRSVLFAESVTALTAEEVERGYASYRAHDLYETNPMVRKVMEQLIDGTLCPEHPRMFQEIYHGLLFGEGKSTVQPNDIELGDKQIHRIGEIAAQHLKGFANLF